MPVSVDNEIVLFEGVTGTEIKRATGTGTVRATAGVYGTVASVNAQIASSAVTATADGLTTGIVPNDTDLAVVTSGNANDIVTLPAPTPGVTVGLSNGATGYELRSSAPATVGINGGVGAAAESAIPANTLVVCICRTATAWLCSNTATTGVVTTTEVSAP